MSKEKEETISNDDVNIKENVPGEEEKSEDQPTVEVHQSGINDTSSRNPYLSFYRSFCTFTLICIPLLYMYVRFEYVKSLMIINNYDEGWYNDGFISDGWFKFIFHPDKKTWFEACEMLDTSPIGMDIIAYILSFMGVLAIKKIISLLLKIDNRTYSLK